MREKTRKILKRMGAGLLLGLSFLNFGTGWGKQKAKSIPRRTQNIRKETKEELSPEIQQVADIAESEAQDVINQEVQEQQQQQQMQAQQQFQTQSQQFLRYATIGGWGVAMAVFFTSMVFNYPFGLGKAVLSVLPGEPHIAVLSASSAQSVWEVDDEVEVQIKLATNQEKVNYFKIALRYDPEVLKFEKIEISKDKFDRLEQNKIDQQKGEIIFIVKKPKEGESFNKGVIGKVYFRALKNADKTGVVLMQKESLVLKTKQKDGKGYNILGKVVPAKFKIIKRLRETVKCQKVDVVKSRMVRAEWERLIKSAPIPLPEGNNWVEVGEKDLSLLCAHSDDGGLYLLVRGKEKIDSVTLSNNLTGNKGEIEKVDNWFDGENYFQTVVVNPSKWIREKPNKFKNVVINIELNKERVRWPEKGSTELLLEE